MPVTCPSPTVTNQKYFYSAELLLRGQMLENHCRRHRARKRAPPDSVKSDHHLPSWCSPLLMVLAHSNFASLWRVPGSLSSFCKIGMNRSCAIFYKLLLYPVDHTAFHKRVKCLCGEGIEEEGEAERSSIKAHPRVTVKWTKFSKKKSGTQYRYCRSSWGHRKLKCTKRTGCLSTGRCTEHMQEQR